MRFKGHVKRYQEDIIIVCSSGIRHGEREYDDRCGLGDKTVKRNRRDSFSLKRQNQAKPVG